MARSAGLKGAKSARDSFNVVYKKLVASNASDDKPVAASASASAAPNKKRKAGTSWRGRRSPSATTISADAIYLLEAVENVDDDDDEDEKVAPLAPSATQAKKKAVPRKTKVKNEEKALKTFNGMYTVLFFLSG